MELTTTKLTSLSWSENNLNQIILDLIPQKHPFRFVDRIIEADENHIIGQYTFKNNEWFYQGHFPEYPLTPGVILIETMAQSAVVGMAIYLLLQEQNFQTFQKSFDCLTVFSEVQAEFLKEVLPGNSVTVKGEKIYWRRRKLKANAELYLSNGELAARAVLSGLGVVK